jgi:hypothetical protein
MKSKPALSAHTRLSIQAKSAAREYNRRLELVKVISRAEHCSIAQACDIMEQRTAASFGELSDDLKADLAQIREEHADETATA